MTIFTKYFTKLTADQTPQSQPLPGTSQVPNSAGAYAWKVDDWMRLDRFLVLGTEGGTYYTSEKELTLANAAALKRALEADGLRVVQRVADVSDAGRAPKNDPAIFALAMAAKLGDDATRKAAYAALPTVCRTGTHLLHFVAYAKLFGGWGRGLRTAVARWFNGKPAKDLAYQLVKYQQRDGWSTRDLLRLAHPRAASPSHDRLFHWVVKGALEGEVDPALALIAAYEQAKSATTIDEIVTLIRDARLPREAVPTQWLRETAVWDALLPAMPVTAILRNLGTMSKIGLLTTGSAAADFVARKLGDEPTLRGARIHPIAVLAALTTYRSGRGAKSDATWTPVGKVIDALDAAFYQTFRAIEPTGKRTMLALDVSGSMSGGQVAGVPGLTPRVASAAMALITAATEANHGFVGFSTQLIELAISPRQRLDDVITTVSGLPFAGTDCALPMTWALAQRRDIDVFVVYTDSETWAGSTHPSIALRKYREKTGIAAKLIVVGMTSNGFTIADPDDAGMLDVVGFDTAAPAVMADFSRA